MSSTSITKAPVFDKSDPRTPDSVIVPFHLPRDWQEHSDWFATVATTLAGAGMMLKNPLAAWVALNAAVLSLFNQRPLRQSLKKDSQTGAGPWTAIGMAFAGLLATYIPRLIINPALQPSAADAAVITPAA